MNTFLKRYWKIGVVLLVTLAGIVSVQMNSFLKESPESKSKRHLELHQNYVKAVADAVEKNDELALRKLVGDFVYFDSEIENVLQGTDLALKSIRSRISADMVEESYDVVIRKTEPGTKDGVLSTEVVFIVRFVSLSGRSHSTNTSQLVLLSSISARSGFLTKAYTPPSDGI